MESVEDLPFPCAEKLKSESIPKSGGAVSLSAEDEYEFLANATDPMSQGASKWFRCNFVPNC